MDCQHMVVVRCIEANPVPGLEEGRREVYGRLPLGVDLERGECHVEALLHDGLHQPVPLPVPPQDAPLRVLHTGEVELELQVVGEFG